MRVGFTNKSILMYTKIENRGLVLGKQVASVT